MDFITTINELIRQYLGPLATWFATLLTKQQWLSFFTAVGAATLMPLAASLNTQIVKWMWTKSPIPGDDNNDKRKKVLRITCVASGIFYGKLLWSPNWYLDWWLAGFLFGGGGALLLWKLTWPIIQIKWPTLADKISIQEKDI